MVMFWVKTVWEPSHLLSWLNQISFYHLLQHQTFNKASVSGTTFIMWVLQMNRKHSQKCVVSTVGICLLLLKTCTEMIGCESERAGPHCFSLVRSNLGHFFLQQSDSHTGRFFETSFLSMKLTNIQQVLHLLLILNTTILKCSTWSIQYQLDKQGKAEQLKYRINIRFRWIRVSGL